MASDARCDFDHAIYQDSSVVPSGRESDAFLIQEKEMCWGNLAIARDKTE